MPLWRCVSCRCGPQVALGMGFLLAYNAALAATGLACGGRLPPRFYLFARAWYAAYFAAACALGLAASRGG
jgi:sodium/potassium/calcium exchanger 6